MSPLSRNQVTQLPNARPPTPHSSRVWLFCGRRHRAARKPTTVTIAKTPAQAPDCTWWVAEVGMSAPPPGGQVDDPDDEREHPGPSELHPVEDRKAEQGRLD